jgi:hypothetical protein
MGVTLAYLGLFFLGLVDWLLAWTHNLYLRLDYVFTHFRGTNDCDEACCC